MSNADVKKAIAQELKAQKKLQETKTDETQLAKYGLQNSDTTSTDADVAAVVDDNGGDGTEIIYDQ